MFHMVDNYFHKYLLKHRGRPSSPGKSTGAGSPHLEGSENLVDLGSLPKSCPRTAQNLTVCDAPRCLALSPSLSFLVSLARVRHREFLGHIYLAVMPKVRLPESGQRPCFSRLNSKCSSCLKELSI